MQIASLSGPEANPGEKQGKDCIGLTWQRINHGYA